MSTSNATFCPRCQTEFGPAIEHDCTITRVEFDGFRRDMAYLAAGLLSLEASKDGAPIWDYSTLRRIAGIEVRERNV